MISYGILHRHEPPIKIMLPSSVGRLKFYYLASSLFDRYFQQNPQSGQCFNQTGVKQWRAESYRRHWVWLIGFFSSHKCWRIFFQRRQLFCSELMKIYSDRKLVGRQERLWVGFVLFESAVWRGLVLWWIRVLWLMRVFWLIRVLIVELIDSNLR
jgi:hypothetical protein